MSARCAGCTTARARGKGRSTLASVTPTGRNACSTTGELLDDDEIRNSFYGNDIIELDEADDRAEIVFGEWLTETLLHGFFCQEENEGAAQIRRCSGGEGRAGRAAMLGELSTARKAGSLAIETPRPPGWSAMCFAA